MKKINLLFCFIVLVFTFSFVLYAQNTNTKEAKAQALMDQGKFFEADKIFDEILESNPSKVDILYNAAYCKFVVGKPYVAINYLKTFIMKNKNDAEAYNLLGLAYERTGFYDDAMTEYSNAIQKDKNLYEAYFNRGRIYLQFDSVELAKKDFNYAKKNKIINPELYYTTGRLYIQLRQYDSALIDLNKILKYKKDDPYYLALLGDAYFVTSNKDTSKLEKAIEYYTKSLALDSENVVLLKNRAFVYNTLDQNEKAELDREKILQIQARDGINPANINYRRLVSSDNSFEIDIPVDWKVFISKNDSLDAIFFFDTNFNYTLQDGFYIYDFGGIITYYPKYFVPDTNNIGATLDLRNEKLITYAEERKAICYGNTIMKNYFEVMRKQFNPNEKIARMLVKYNFVLEDRGKFFGVEYFCVSKAGKLVAIQLWLPYENYFHYEALLDYIYESLEVEVE